MFEVGGRSIKGEAMKVEVASMKVGAALMQV
jgi:hypothetical protein